MIAKFSGAKVLLNHAPKGNGVIAASAARAVIDKGITKLLGT